MCAIDGVAWYENMMLNAYSNAKSLFLQHSITFCYRRQNVCVCESLVIWSMFWFVSHLGAIIVYVYIQLFSTQSVHKWDPYRLTCTQA